MSSGEDHFLTPSFYQLPILFCRLDTSWASVSPVWEIHCWCHACSAHIKEVVLVGTYGCSLWYYYDTQPYRKSLLLVFVPLSLKCSLGLEKKKVEKNWIPCPQKSSTALSASGGGSGVKVFFPLWAAVLTGFILSRLCSSWHDYWESNESNGPIMSVIYFLSLVLPGLWLLDSLWHSLPSWYLIPFHRYPAPLVSVNLQG